MINLFEYQNDRSKYSSILSKLQNFQDNFNQNWHEMCEIVSRLQKHFIALSYDIHNQLKESILDLNNQQEAERIMAIVENDIIDAQNYVFALIRNAERQILKEGQQIRQLKQTLETPQETPNDDTIATTPVLNTQVEDVIIGHITRFVQNKELKEYYLKHRDDLSTMPEELIRIQNNFNGFDEEGSLYGVSTMFINSNEFEGRAAICNDVFIEDGIYKKGSLIYGTRLYFLGKDNIMLEKGSALTKSHLGPRDFIAIADKQLISQIFSTLPSISPGIMLARIHSYL